MIFRSRKNIIISTILLGGIGFYLMPFLLMFTGEKYRDIFFTDYLMNNLYDNLTSDCDTRECQLMSCYEFVRDQVAMPPQSINNGFTLDVVSRGWGYCDQQARVLNWLVEKGGFHGNLIFLYGDYEYSGHSLVEIKFDNKYQIFDPSLKYTFNNNEGERASFDEVQNSQISLDSIDNALVNRSYYKTLFTKKVPYRVIDSTRVGKRIDRWSKWQSSRFIETLSELYFILDCSSETKKERIKELIGPNIKYKRTKPTILLDSLNMLVGSNSDHEIKKRIYHQLIYDYQL